MQKVSGPHAARKKEWSVPIGERPAQFVVPEQTMWGAAVMSSSANLG